MIRVNRLIIPVGVSPVRPANPVITIIRMIVVPGAVPVISPICSDMEMCAVPVIAIYGIAHPAMIAVPPRYYYRNVHGGAVVVNISNRGFVARLFFSEWIYPLIISFFNHSYS
jgi:hypothetical protein